MKAFENRASVLTPDPSLGTDQARPAVFLMNDSFETGGSERQFAALAQALRPDLFQVRIGCLRRRGTFMKGIEVAEFHLGGSFLSLQALRARMALARHLRAQQSAIAHSFDFYSNLMLIPVARLAGVPVVIGSHRQLGDLLSPLQFAAQGAVFRLCDRVVCNARAVADRLLDQGLSEHKVVVIPNGLPAETFAETAPALARSPEMLRVGLIARMNDPVKNHPVFLRAAARLAQKFPSVEFLLVGDGSLRPGLQKMAAQFGLADRARFLGERHDIPAVLAAMDVSVVTSASEGLSNVILESMAAGVPVVATRVGGNSELVRDGETGLLVPLDNEDRLVKGLEFLLAQPALRKEWGLRARELARANFSMDQIRDRYERLYTALLVEKGWHPDTHRPRSLLTDGSLPVLRVGIVAPSLRHWMGGQAVQAGLLVRHWHNDPAVEISFIPVDPELPPWLRWVWRIPFLRTAVREAWYLPTLWRGVKNIEIAHIFAASYWSFLLDPVAAWVVARLRGKKTLINYRSGEASDHLRRWRTAVPVLRRADRLVVPSGYLVEVFRKFGLEAQVVPNIVDLDQFSYRPRQPLHPRLVCTRAFETYYSVDVVVRAFAQVKKEFPAAHLCLVGDGTLDRQIRALARDLKLADIEFAGRISREQIGRFYDQADIFINASWVDNMPVSVLEAFASGTPVVTTAPGGIPYIVEHGRTGLLSTPGDWQGLAKNVIHLLRDPDLASRLASNAYEESRRYRWEAVRAQWLEIYQGMRELRAQKEMTSARRFVSDGSS